MKIYRRIDDGGQPSFGSVEDGKRLPARAVEVDRWPGPFEDFVKGKWVYDADDHANQLAGTVHIAEAHAQKRIEALLVKMGLSLPAEIALLPGEAQDKGISLEEMADIVAAKVASFQAKEQARQAPGVEATKGDG